MKKKDLYEVTVILRGSLEVEAQKKRSDEVISTIETAGGKVTNSPEPTKRELSYAIKKEREGYYLFLDATIPAAKIQDIDTKFRINDAVLRHLILVKKDKVEEAKA